jgi:hypothetical protein
VVVAAALAALVRPPVRRTGPEAVRGHRVLPVAPADVRTIALELDGRRLTAERVDGRWAIDGARAAPRAADALDDLVETLATLRAVDVFRSRDADSYGLDSPRGAIDVVSARGARRRLVLGGLNAAGAALYARRDGDPRVLQVGTLVLTEMERALRARDASGPVSGR